MANKSRGEGLGVLLPAEELLQARVQRGPWAEQPELDSPVFGMYSDGLVWRDPRGLVMPTKTQNNKVCMCVYIYM